jgi:alkaline phosphatase D
MAGVTPVRTPASKRGRVTRAALVRAARDVFERDGFPDARISDIAARAGAPRSRLIRSRPTLPYGVQGGDPLADGAVVWTRADRSSRMVVEVAATERFAGARRIRGPLLGPGTDYTGQVTLHDLPPGEEIFYRVFAEDLRDPSVRSHPVSGSLRTAPRGRRDVTFAWSADLAGQGWGINPAAGGYRIFGAIQALAPDFYQCSGDHVYADNPLTESGPASAPAGWRQIVTEAKSKVAETLDDYRGQYAYNLLDTSLRSFNAQVTQVHQWDDHEVRNNWHPGQLITDPRYHERRRPRRAGPPGLSRVPAAAGAGAG